MPTNHAREAAERILSHVSCASDCPDIEQVIQSAIDAATAELQAKYTALLSAAEASDRGREKAESLVRELTKPRDPSREYEGLSDCDHCGRETIHVIHNSGHERDSSHDWRQCKVCGWRLSGMTGEYSPPIEGSGKP